MHNSQLSIFNSVVPSPATRRMTLSTSPTIVGSSADVGSSNNSIWGTVASARTKNVCQLLAV